MSGRKDQVTAVAILRPQQLRPHGIPPAALLPQPSRGQHRQGDPLGPDSGHGVVDEVGELSNAPGGQGQVVEQSLAVFNWSYESLKLWLLSRIMLLDCVIFNFITEDRGNKPRI